MRDRFRFLVRHKRYRWTQYAGTTLEAAKADIGERVAWSNSFDDAEDGPPDTPANYLIIEERVTTTVRDARGRRLRTTPKGAQ